MVRFIVKLLSSCGSDCISKRSCLRISDASPDDQHRPIGSWLHRLLKYDAKVSASSGGFGCATLASMRYCGSELCPTFSSSGYCDAACGYCPTSAPTTSPCIDYDAEVSASSGGLDCVTLMTMGYCASTFCQTCSNSGYPGTAMLPTAIVRRRRRRPHLASTMTQKCARVRLG